MKARAIQYMAESIATRPVMAGRKRQYAITGMFANGAGGTSRGAMFITGNQNPKVDYTRLVTLSCFAQIVTERNTRGRREISVLVFRY